MIAAIQTNATIEIEKIKADLEKARMADARYRAQLAADEAKTKVEAEQATKQEQIRSDREISNSRPTVFPWKRRLF